MTGRYKKYHFFLCLVTLSFTVDAQEIEKIYYEDGSIKAEGVLENGIKSGPWYYFYPSGKISSEENYKEDQLDGVIKYFDDQGNLIASENWLNGNQEDSSVYFYPNGQIEKKGIFNNSLYEGKWLFYF
ncbi:MAG: hypothetical protein KAQ79_09495, partial [Cyclobacteriaceae bacterium]|nr:hypothetical protein [Cyclobacteriaceae bacterium]